MDRSRRRHPVYRSGRYARKGNGQTNRKTGRRDERVDRNRLFGGSFSCRKLGIKPEVFEKTDIHVHVPEGATPKDGPSAGIAMYTTLVSVLTKIPVRKDVAMTGEITLQGRVLPIGGLKEKLLSALRGGIKTVIIPKDNEKDLVEIADNVKEGLRIIPVSTADEVLDIALHRDCKLPE